MVQRIRELCKQKGITIAELERRCGIGNGIIARWEKSKPSYDRLLKVAEELDSTVDYLKNGEKTEKAPTQEGERQISDDDIMFALWGDCEEMDQADLDDVKKYADYVRERKRKK